ATARAMAPVLKCPDCGEKHPLASVPTHGAFPCQGCGRVLKVPEAVGPRAPSPAAAPAPRPVPVATAVARSSPTPSPAPNATRVVPEVDQRALGGLAAPAMRPVHRLGSVPWWMRLLLWFVAVPLSFVLVFLIARGLHLFTT